MNPGPIIVEQEIHASPGRLWEAISRPEEMRKWFFPNIPDFEARVGFRTQFPVDTGERVFTHVWEILEAEEGRRIVYHWSYAEYPGEGRVTFEISAHDTGSKISLNNEGLHTFPQKVPEFSRESCEGGWRYILNALASYLA